jgi:hypothetical protein
MDHGRKANSKPSKIQPGKPTNGQSPRHNPHETKKQGDSQPEGTHPGEQQRRPSSEHVIVDRLSETRVRQLEDSLKVGQNEIQRLKEIETSLLTSLKRQEQSIRDKLRDWEEKRAKSKKDAKQERAKVQALEEHILRREDLHKMELEGNKIALKCLLDGQIELNALHREVDWFHYCRACHRPVAVSKGRVLFSEQFSPHAIALEALQDATPSHDSNTEGIQTVEELQGDEAYPSITPRMRLRTCSL